MNTSTYNRTRWLTLFGTIVTQFALGSVYTWSLFNSALSDKLGAPVSQVAFSFGLLSLGWRFLFRRGQAAGAFWREARDHGVRHPAGVGFFLTAHSSNLMMLWLSAGVLVGWRTVRVIC
jgi:OFA family oxalate/formate antiporter-like MFS transporter